MSEVVELTIPARADLVPLARLAASTVAVRAGFDVEEVEDLRLAVSELCAAFVGGSDTSEQRLELRLVRHDDLVEVSCRLAGSGSSAAAGGPLRPDDGLSWRIVDALVDEHGRDDDAAGPGLWLRKRRGQPSS